MVRYNGYAVTAQQQLLTHTLPCCIPLTYHVTVPDGNNLEDASGHAISIEAGEEICAWRANTASTS